MLVGPASMSEWRINARPEPRLGITQVGAARQRRIWPMPGPRIPLPPFLSDTPFTVAQGRSVGLGRGRMAGGDLERPFRNVRLSRRDSAELAGQTQEPPAPTELARRCAALLVALPHGACLSHLTAGRLWPLPLPSAPDDEPVHVSVPGGVRSPRRTGVIGHQLTDPRASVANRRGLPMVDAATLFCQLSAALSLPDLVAVGDALVLRPVFAEPWQERPWVTLPELTERVQIFRGRGKLVAATAVALIRPGVESRPETLLRLTIVDAGLPEPEVNVDVFDPRGRFLARGDLVYRRWKVIAEYDGDQHRTSTRQFDKDVRRLDDLAANHWRVVRIVGRSFFTDRRECIERVARALTEAGWRPDPARASR